MGMSIPAGLVRTGEERATLVRRTYTLVFVSILVTMVGATYAMSNAALMATVARHPFLSMLCVFIPLLAAQGARTRFPLNIGMVMLFTFAMGVISAPSLVFYQSLNPDRPILAEAAALTVGAFGVLTVYAFLSRRDFSAWGGFLSVGLWVLIGTMLLNLWFQNSMADMWIAGVTVFLFSGLLIFDTWRLRNVFGPDDYVIAAVQIYLDLLNLFMAILRILGGSRRS